MKNMKGVTDKMICEKTFDENLEELLAINLHNKAVRRNRKEKGIRKIDISFIEKMDEDYLLIYSSLDLKTLDTYKDFDFIDNPISCFLCEKEARTPKKGTVTEFYELEDEEGIEHFCPDCLNLLQKLTANEK
ncbi:hypothetical protein [Ammoniphilus sp. 3BR4]|uniref:hypothetical protein n=1 Tax=Ammoniphilus sp. 3BR4 TaxID=3158265 RepID=UPI003465B797